MKERGISLVSILVALSIGAVVIAVVGVLYENLTRLQVRAQLLGEVDGLVRLVQDQLNNPAVCSYALRQLGQKAALPLNNDGTPPDDIIRWNPEDPDPNKQILDGDTEFGKIVLVRPSGADNNPLPGTQPENRLAYLKQMLAPNDSKINSGFRLVLNKMILREPNDREGGPARDTAYGTFDSGTGRKSFPYNVYAAKIEFTFQANSLSFPENGGVLPPRTVNLTVGVNPADQYKMYTCYGSRSARMQISNARCDLGNTPVPCPKPSPGCSQFTYVNGIDFTKGTVSCGCSIVCGTTPAGPPGPYIGSGGGHSASAAPPGGSVNSGGNLFTAGAVLNSGAVEGGASESMGEN